MAAFIVLRSATVVVCAGAIGGARDTVRHRTVGIVRQERGRRAVQRDGSCANRAAHSRRSSSHAVGIGSRARPHHHAVPSGERPADRWDLRYHSNETDDGGATGGPTGDAIHIDKELNSENVDGQDIVVWYRAGYYYTVALTPDIVGPTLYPFGPW